MCIDKRFKQFTMKNEIQKFSLAKCRSALEKNGSVYTDEQIISIRDFLYRMAQLDYEVYLKLKLREMEFEKEKKNRCENSEIKDAA